MESLPLPLLSAFTMSLLHTMIPSHWLCFVLVGKAQGWSRKRMLGITATAGLIHVVVNVTLGAALAFAGQKLIDMEHHEHLLTQISAGILILLGLIYLAAHVLHAGHHHEQDKALTGKAAVLALSFSLALSPCSAAIILTIVPIAGAGWTTILAISGVLLATTVPVMLLLVGLTSLGVERLQFAAFERYEKLILGVIFCIVGSMILVFHEFSHG
jgi:cytochrome c biogenesis protein CcdA